MVLVHFQAGISFLDRVNVHLSLPLSVFQSGTSAAGLSALSTAAVGDPRLGIRVRIFNHADRDAFSLHAGGNFYFNAGLFGLPQTANTTDGNFRGRLYLQGAGRVGPFAWSLGIGGHFRESYDATLTQVSSELYTQAGVGILADRDRFQVGIEFLGSTMLNHPFEWRYLNAELLAGVHYTIADAVLVGAGAGPGLTQGVGTPDARALFQLAYAPIQRETTRAASKDQDLDGVQDAEDLCVTVPAGIHPDPHRAGCPEQDSDHDGVLDSQDQCVNTPAGDHPDPARKGCPEQDSDNDGVLDSQDQCVNTPAGDHPDPQRAGCPDEDNDQDGVFNSQDQCINVAQGNTPDPARAGCPIPDRDQDAVADDVDHCPDQPGAPSADPMTNGCPNQDVTVQNCQIQVASPVFVATNRDVILARSSHVLTAVADALKNASAIRKVSIEGHTDDVGDGAHNTDLSQRRAVSVMRWLVEHGIDESRLEAHGYGSTRPVQNPEGLSGALLRSARRANRRVQFRIVDGGPGCTGSTENGR